MLNLRFFRIPGIIAVAVLSSGCLLLVPAPKIISIEDMSFIADEGSTDTITLADLVIDDGGRDITFTYTIEDGEGRYRLNNSSWRSIEPGSWKRIEEETIAFSFEDPGNYTIVITASNGLKSSQAVFTAFVSSQ